MATQKYKITYTGFLGRKHSAIVNSAKERDGVLRFMKQRGEKDTYNNIRVKKIKSK